MDDWIKDNLRTLQRGLPLLTMTERERRLLDFVVAQGKVWRWTVYRGNNVGRALAIQMDWNESSAQKALKALRDRGWVALKFDGYGSPQLMVTKTLGQLCETAVTRQRVRSLIGPEQWEYICGDNKMADQIAEAASKMVMRYRDAVKLLARQRAEDVQRTIRPLAADNSSARSGRSGLRAVPSSR